MQRPFQAFAPPIKFTAGQIKKCSLRLQGRKDLQRSSNNPTAVQKKTKIKSSISEQVFRFAANRLYKRLFHRKTTLIKKKDKEGKIIERNIYKGFATLADRAESGSRKGLKIVKAYRKTRRHRRTASFACIEISLRRKIKLKKELQP